MSEADEDDGKLTLRKPGRLELKKTVETGQVRQSFSHGRSKAVTVEVKKKRTFERGASGKMHAVPEHGGVLLPGSLTPVGEDPLATEAHSLTEEERAARFRALTGAAHEAERDQLVEVEASRRAEEEAIRQAEEDARLKVEEDARKLEADSRRKVEEEAQLAAAEVATTTPSKVRPAREPVDESEAPTSRRPGGAEQKRPGPTRSRQEPRRRAGKLTIAQALDEDAGERGRSLAAIRRAREREKKRTAEIQGEPTKIVRDVVVPESITVVDLANRMAERGTEVVKTLMKLDMMATINDVLDGDTAELVVVEFGHRVTRVSESDVEIGIGGVADDAGSLVVRAPIVTVMGHVDHGKTSLLDALRETDVAGGEAGGITQHIGAHQIELSNGNRITFLDTPGHEAFTAMRARGAQVTDIIVLVVAADDGVQPQTIEAIHHAKAAGVPIIIAINKMDKAGADPDRVRNELLQHEIIVEKMSGDILDVEVSATAKTNLDKLEEAILLQSEVLELRANPDRAAQGTIIEAKLERGRGSVATVLVQSGTLNVGDVFIAGSEWGRVRALIDERGKNVESAGPSTPTEVLGLQEVPSAGDDFAVVEGEARAREIAEYRKRKVRDNRAALSARGSLEEMFSQIESGEATELPVLVKGDVQGSVEAIIGALEGLSTDEVKVQALHAAVGGITESDVTLAHASGGLIIGFNVRANPQAREMAKRDIVDIRYYSIIYNVIDEIKGILGGLLSPERRETTLGHSEIRDVFSVSRAGKIAGCMVTDGFVRRGAKIRLLRDDVVVYDGGLKTLKRFKDEVREVQHGFECGMALENYDDIKVGDNIECYEVEEVARTL
jgi:translation initiation factor IF-2